MPVVPTYQPQVEATALPSEAFNTEGAKNLAAGQAIQMGEGMTSFGGAIGDIAADMKEKADATRAQDADNQAFKLMTDLHTEASQLHGKDALERPDGQMLPDEYGTKFDQGLAKIRAGLSNPQQQQMFDRFAMQKKNDLYGALSTHMVNQQFAYTDGVKKSTIQIKADAAGSAGADTAKYQQYMRETKDAILDYVHFHGGSPEESDTMLLHATAGIEMARYRGWSQNDPAAALLDFQHNKDNISGLARDEIGDNLYRAAMPQTVDMAMHLSYKKVIDGKSGNPLIDGLNPAQRFQVAKASQAQAREMAAQARSELMQNYNDSLAMLENTGQTNIPIMQKQLVGAYGERKGGAMWDAYQMSAQVGQFRNMSNENIKAYVSAPIPDGEGYAERLKQQNYAKDAADKIFESRKKDSMGVATRSDNEFGIQPIRDFSNQQAVAQELARRHTALPLIAAKYGTKPSLLSNEEAQQLGDYYESLQPPEQAQLMKTIQSGGSLGLGALGAQLKDSHQKLAAVAMVASRDSAAATLVARGQQYLDEGRVKLSPAQVAEIENGIADDLFTDKRARPLAIEAAKAIAAAKVIDSPRGKDNAKEAIQGATGGTMVYSGKQIVKPNGWSDDKFNDFMSNDLPKVLTDGKFTANAEATQQAMGRDYYPGDERTSGQQAVQRMNDTLHAGARLQSYKEGTYLVLSGNQPWIDETTGQPFVLDAVALEKQARELEHQERNRELEARPHFAKMRARRPGEDN